MKFTIGSLLALASVAVSSVSGACWDKLSPDAAFSVADNINFSSDFGLMQSSLQSICTDAAMVDVYVLNGQATTGYMCLRDSPDKVRLCGQDAPCCAPAAMNTGATAQMANTTSAEPPANTTTSITANMYGTTYASPEGQVGTCKVAVDFSKSDAPSAALPSSEFKDGYCDSCVFVTGPGGNVSAKIVSAGGETVPAGSLLLSQSAADQISAGIVGTVSVTYTVGACQ